MPFGPLPKSANLYIVNTILIVGYMLSAIIGLMVKKNYFFGVRTPESFSDPEVWEKANKRVSFIILAFTIPLLIINLIFAFLKLKEQFPGAILIVFAIGMIIINTYALKYTQNLGREKGVEIRKVTFPVYVIITLILLTVALGVVWYLMFK